VLKKACKHQHKILKANGIEVKKMYTGAFSDDTFSEFNFESDDYQEPHSANRLGDEFQHDKVDVTDVDKCEDPNCNASMTVIGNKDGADSKANLLDIGGGSLNSSIVHGSAKKGDKLLSKPGVIREDSFSMKVDIKNKGVSDSDTK